MLTIFTELQYVIMCDEHADDILLHMYIVTHTHTHTYIYIGTTISHMGD